MKISNAITYAIMPGALPADVADVADGFAAHAFTPCGLTEELSLGFVPPREENGALVEAVGGQWVAKLMIETRAVPASAIRREMKVRLAAIEASTGRKPGKKEQRDIKDEIHHDLLPQAFPKQAAVNLWINPAAMTLVLDTTSQKKADMVATAVVKVVVGLGLMLPVPVKSPAAAMASWLLDQDPPPGFTIDRDLELKAADESGRVVRYSNHALDIDEVANHIRNWLLPTRLALTWEGRVSFVLTDQATVRSIALLEAGMGGDSNQADAFDANVAITTATLAPMLAALTESLGGVAQATIGA
jgi:recombination associated protein RdgC